MRTYWMVGATLAVFTVVTVMVSLIPAFDLGGPGRGFGDIVLALSIATFKGSLVLLIFMHLNHERGLIYKSLLFTMVFAVALMTLSLFAEWDHVRVHAEALDENAAQDATPRVTQGLDRDRL